jgi:hypothetical protein
LESIKKRPHTIFQRARTDFQGAALELFRHQARHNPVYKEYLELLGINPASIHNLSQIPHLPVDFFKTHQVVTGDVSVEKSFKSSSTTGSRPSQHHVADLSLYEHSCINTFEQFYGSLNNYCVLALLPHYLERENASLVHMAKIFIQHSDHPLRGF